MFTEFSYHIRRLQGTPSANANMNHFHQASPSATSNFQHPTFANMLHVNPSVVVNLMLTHSGSPPNLLTGTVSVLTFRH
jgi:hypothetical protein